MSLATKPIYILGTGLSHDGSACVLKDGRIAVAIEKERITRLKHDGGNDLAAVQYCLDALGIRFTDLDLVVQVANFEKDIADDYYCGKRLHHPDVPVVTISHHLAHAYSAVATSPFAESNVLVIDGAGSPAPHCEDWPDEHQRNYWLSQTGYYCEKDSFYRYADHRMISLQKDFSACRLFDEPESAIRMPTNYHSIGGLYAAASHYCFGNLDDAGKLMGLAPYGSDAFTGIPVFVLEGGTVTVNHKQMALLQQPAEHYVGFQQHFQHYAAVAKWIQQETERAVAYLATQRVQAFPHENLCYAGGVALNAVANARLLNSNLVKRLYMQPAAGDNGLSLGCAYYGWNHLLQNEIPRGQSPTVFFGKTYAEQDIQSALTAYESAEAMSWHRDEDYIATAAALLAEGKVIGWFQGGAEFGPRALGHRSILADPRRSDIQKHINAHIKFREDFRPFAPSVLQEDVSLYFRHGFESPHMILVDEILDEWKDKVPGVVHVDGTCRVQTVDDRWNPIFGALLRAFREQSGVGMLVNTSFNRKGMPIVETPAEALDFFMSCALDALFIHDFVVLKNKKVNRASIAASMGMVADR